MASDDDDMSGMDSMKHKAGSLLAIAFGRPKRDGGEGDDSGGEEYEEAGDDGLEAAADEVFDALKVENRRAFKEALISFVRMCKADDYADDDADSSEYDEKSDEMEM